MCLPSLASLALTLKILSMRSFNPLPVGWEPASGYRPVLRGSGQGFMRCVARNGSWEVNGTLKVDRPREGRVNMQGRWLAPWPVCAPNSRAPSHVILKNEADDDDEVPYKLKPPSKEKSYWADIIEQDVEKVLHWLQKIARFKSC